MRNLGLMDLSSADVLLWMLIPMIIIRWGRSSNVWYAVMGCTCPAYYSIIFRSINRQEGGGV
jgi:hypothetical protein